MNYIYWCEKIHMRAHTVSIDVLIHTYTHVEVRANVCPCSLDELE